MSKDNLSGLIRGIQKNLGGAARISSMSEVSAPFLTRLPTGILSLDLALKGGFPAGSMHQLFGPDGAGKDFLSNLVIAQIQKDYGEKANIAWMSFGYKPDIPFMEMCGIDTEVGNLMFIDIGSEEALEQPAESLLTAMLDLIRSNKFQLMVINELGSGETKDNVKKVRLNALVDAPAATAADTNDDIYSYYDKLNGDVKFIVSCTVITPSLYGIDVGDLVKFTGTMPVDPLGAAWTNKVFMTISVQRTVGQIKCKFREVT